MTRPQRSPEVSAEIESTRSSIVKASSTRQPVAQRSLMSLEKPVSFVFPEMSFRAFSQEASSEEEQEAYKSPSFSRTMESASDHLLDALDDLEVDELKRFKWRLKNRKGFSRADLEKADAPDTVDLMMKCFVPEEAVKITVDILRKMNQNHLAEQLEKKHKQEAVPKTRNDFLQYSHRITLDLNTVNKRLHLSERNRVITDTNTPQSYPDHPDRFDYYHQVLCRESVSDRRCYWEIERRGEHDSHQLALDLNTVNKHLRLSERNRVITDTNTPQSYPDHPDRFDYYLQVLCRESVCDRRCYWEVERRGEHGVSISVSYKSISRKGEGYECEFGYNDQSWSLECSSSSYLLRHNNTETNLPVEPISSRVGVNVDHRAGTLSFYSVSGDTMILIHTVQTTFTQPLYPGFRVLSYGSSVKLC
ncbi:Stonustoxin subunit alpha [Anabarilius grahami]|uniref:Stonustoxin subunit alpha n=1 Tax=Anabarilius grahami TaxID=495550 RepID=A0A3N0Z6J5_ANAGA|nr:Stonustoxin subunit alpha [Anabarilius grahami]